MRSLIDAYRTLLSKFLQRVQTRPMVVLVCYALPVSLCAYR